MYQVSILPRARKDIDGLEGKLFHKVVAVIRSLGGEPRPRGCLKLSEEENGYRIRVRDVRILYRIDDKIRQVVIYRVKHRREAYR